MNVSFAIDLTPEDEKQLAGILNKKPAELGGAFTPFAQAASLEYVRMFLGQKIFTRGSDMREYRLFVLIRVALADTLPDEQTICALFQCTITQSRSLLRAVMSKYQYELRPAIDNTVIQTLKKVIKDANDLLLVTVNSENVVEEFNKVLVSIDGSLDQIVRRTGMLATYELKPAAYKALCTKYKVEPIE